MPKKKAKKVEKVMSKKEMDKYHKSKGKMM